MAVAWSPSLLSDVPGPGGTEPVLFPALIPVLAPGKLLGARARLGGITTGLTFVTSLVCKLQARPLMSLVHRTPRRRWCSITVPSTGSGGSCLGPSPASAPAAGGILGKGFHFLFCRMGM